MAAEEFMPVEEHFNELVNTLDEGDRNLYDACTHVRVETGYLGRHFVVYTIRGRDPVERDRLIVQDFSANETEGASSEVESVELGEKMVLTYTPQRVFDYPFFMFMPLHGKIRWGAAPGQSAFGSLGFPIIIRTQSRRHLREAGVTYCETGVTYSKEFNLTAQA